MSVTMSVTTIAMTWCHAHYRHNHTTPDFSLVEGGQVVLALAPTRPNPDLRSSSRWWSKLFIKTRVRGTGRYTRIKSYHTDTNRGQNAVQA